MVSTICARSVQQINAIVETNVVLSHLFHRNVRNGGDIADLPM
jgi:hypothetical protein